MRPPILTPEQFMRWLHLSIPELSHEVDIRDIKDMIGIGLIFRHKYFLSDDMEVVRKVIAFIKSREERKRVKNTVKTCKRCNVPLPDNDGGRKGRKREYCPDCDPFRGAERYRKWHDKKEIASSCS